MPVKKKQLCSVDCFNCVFDDCINNKKCLANEQNLSDSIDKDILGYVKPHYSPALTVKNEWYLQGTIKDKTIREKLDNNY